MTVTLYGTSEPAPETEVITRGALSLTLQGGAIRHVRLGGVELLRGISFLVRDRDWGTLSPAISDITRVEGDTFRYGYRATYSSGGTTLVADLSITIWDNLLEFAAVAVPDADFETNRTGFTVLHPAAAAGARAAITHGDGSVEESRFPELIDPWQPFMDIAAMTHEAEGVTVTCTFTGDVFETEDQRQWGDASFKTYVRPLALPWPYHLPANETLRQSVRLEWQDGGGVASESEHAQAFGTVPDLALVLTGAEARRLAKDTAHLALVAPQRLLCHVDATSGADPQIAAFADLQRVLPDLIYDMELICAFTGDPLPELLAHAASCQDHGFAPASVMVCPSVDRQSTPPGSSWPDCPPLEQVHDAAATAFPDILRGGGMASFFPELNRKRPPVGMLDFVTHGFCPIVHAADDVSVLETLEAVPHITRSARAIMQGKDYRIGPSTIAMRQNPYGSRTIPNPDRTRVCMADDDPRHSAAFGAAYTVGLAAQLAQADPAVWTLCGLYGSRGIDSKWPVTSVLRALSAIAGQTVTEAGIRDGIAVLATAQRRIEANLTHKPRAGLPPFGWRETVVGDAPTP